MAKMIARRLRRIQFSFRWYYLGGLGGVVAIALGISLLMMPVAMENINLPIPDGLDNFTLENRGFPPPLAPILATDGSQGTLSSFTGKVTLVNIWATWCVPCIIELPTLERLQARFPQTEFQVITVAIDQEGWPKVAEFSENFNMTLPVYLDASGPNLSQFEYFSLPTTILLDRNGLEIGRQIGAALWDRDRGVHLIERALDGRL